MCAYGSSHLTLEPETSESRLSDRLDVLAAEHGLPGSAVAARRNGHEVFAAGTGARDVDGALPVTPDTGFGVASVTKFLTAVLILQARDRGLLELTDPVSRFYPDLNCARDAEMRLYHLLSHSAGLPGLPFRHLATPSSDAEGPGKMRTPGDLVAGMNATRIEMLGAPGAYVSYSNEGFCLLGGIVEMLGDCSFAEVADRWVLRPLGMHRSFFCAGVTKDRTDLAMPLHRGASGLQACGFWDAPLFFPAGGLVASVRDMARLISVLEGDTQVLGAKAARDMISWSLPVASRQGSGARYGLGLEVSALENGHVLGWHTGQRPGISSFVCHVVNGNVSVAFAANIADAPSAAIGGEVLAELLAPESRDRSQPPLAGRSASAGTDAVCGRYGSREMGVLKVARAGDRLMVDLPSGRHELAFETPYSGIVAGQTFCFLREGAPASARQTATALALDLRILPRLGGEGSLRQ